MPYPVVFVKYLQNPLYNCSKIFSNYSFIHLGQKDAKCKNLFFYQNYTLTPLVDAGVNKILLYFFLIPAFVIFPLFIFQINVSSDVPRGIFILVYSYERPNFGILKRRYIFIYSNIFHRSYVSSFKTWVKFVFCFKVRLL